MNLNKWALNFLVFIAILFWPIFWALDLIKPQKPASKEQRFDVILTIFGFFLVAAITLGILGEISGLLLGISIAVYFLTIILRMSYLTWWSPQRLRG